MHSSEILLREEIVAVVADLHRRQKRSVNSQRNLIVFRLACCCGLRRKEICGLNLGDFVLGGPRPIFRVRKEITKGRTGKKKARRVPLYWSPSTLTDLTAWYARRVSEGAKPNDPFLAGGNGTRLTVDLVAKRWKTAIRVLGTDRVSQLSIHKGRHSFCSHALVQGRSLTEVRDAAGHANITTTNIYLHALGTSSCRDIFDVSE